MWPPPIERRYSSGQRTSGPQVGSGIRLAPVRVLRFPYLGATWDL
jgi:hypothetical protein